MQKTAHFLPLFLLAAAGSPCWGAPVSVGPIADTTTDSKGDVIGDRNLFDVHSLSFTFDRGANLVLVNILTNYRNGTTDLNLPITSVAHQTIYIGDLLFDDASTGQYIYGVPLYGHNGLTPGYLYSLSSAPRTARDVLGNPSGLIYRPDSYVWINTATQVGTGTIATDGGGDGPGPQIGISLAFSAPAHFWDLLSPTTGLSVHFAAATCANDLFYTVLRPDLGGEVPEPLTTALAGAGLVALGLLRRFRGGGA